MSLDHKDYVLPVPDLSSREDPEQAARSRTWRSRTSYADYWDLCIARPWAVAVAAYEASPDDVCAAYWYLDTHPVFWRFRGPPILSGLPLNHVSLLEHGHAFWHGSIEIEPHGIPAAGREEDETRILPPPGTKLEWWYEFGPADLLPHDEAGISVQGTWHDWMLDGAAATYEQAVLDIAHKVWTHYGNDRAVVDTGQWRQGDRAYRPQAGEEADA